MHALVLNAARGSILPRCSINMRALALRGSAEDPRPLAFFFCRRCHSGKSVWCSSLQVAPAGLPWTADSSTFLFFAH